jgi:hypothetical protein
LDISLVAASRSSFTTFAGTDSNGNVSSELVCVLLVSGAACGRRPTPASYAQYTHVVLQSRWFICNHNAAISTSSVKHIYRSGLVKWSPSCPATSFPFYFLFFFSFCTPSAGLFNPLSRHCLCVECRPALHLSGRLQWPGRPLCRRRRAGKRRTGQRRRKKTIVLITQLVHPLEEQKCGCVIASLVK